MGVTGKDLGFRVEGLGSGFRVWVLGFGSLPLLKNDVQACGQNVDLMDGKNAIEPWTPAHTGADGSW